MIKPTTYNTTMLSNATYTPKKKKKLTFFIIVELANFYLFSFVPTNNITNNLPLGVNFWCPYS